MSNIAVAKLDNFSSYEDMLPIAEHLISSGFLPPALNEPSKVIAVIVQGRELGFPAMAALSHIHIIQGKPALSVHAVGALLKRKGIKYSLIEDCVPIDKYGSVVNPADYPDKKIPDGTIVNQRTTFMFYEWDKDMKRVIENKASFTRAEADTMGLLGKDNWKRMFN